MYSAPELLHGDMYEATAVDVWASGVLLVVSLLGAFPWVSAKRAQELHQQRPMGIGLCANQDVQLWRWHGP